MDKILIHNKINYLQNFTLLERAVFANNETDFLQLL